MKPTTKQQFKFHNLDGSIDIHESDLCMWHTRCDHGVDRHGNPAPIYRVFKQKIVVLVRENEEDHDQIHYEEIGQFDNLNDAQEACK